MSRTVTGTVHSAKRIVIDGMQFARWSRKVFEQMRDGGVCAVHVTVAYHENFRDTVDLLVDWNRRLRLHGDLIGFAGSGEEMDAVIDSGRTAILFGLQNPSSIEADIGLVEMLHRLGIRFMQLAYNNQSLLCTGWTERNDSGLTNMGREVVREMNRLGMIIDMSHAAERSILDAIEYSARPVVVSHANPYAWRNTHRNISDPVLDALAQSGGMLGLSLYPGHMIHGSHTTLDDFARMVAGLAERIGPARIGIGSDLCQEQPPSVLAWMREGRWKHVETDEDVTGGFPPQPDWFRSNLDFGQVRGGLERIGFDAAEIDGILGENWHRFLHDALSGHAPAPGTPAARDERNDGKPLFGGADGV
ncbi:membrane dipeptidase [Paraburkholderia sp. Ac-20342]|uniref:membrane dipeptidase n=1 Tax=Paraburkholderia sp. Ac-20342 TaxID=2703889 RepID=UPI00198182D2|nr:membrane dipeptidase [Paraburkholderia sp. Ac-20342]MBN3849304.1 membrane dipeptidase [Paraburkholderia sp. Ac-20342]